MDYKETREYLDGINRFGSVLGMESIEALLTAFDTVREPYL